MIPENVESKIPEMKDNEEKKLLEILKDKGKPYKHKYDGHAAKVEEDIQIDYKDWEGNERTLKVPAGSYVVLEHEGGMPKIVTASDFEAKNKFIEDKKKEKQDGQIGIALIAE